jgi:hypothetical protein
MRQLETSSLSFGGWRTKLIFSGGLACIILAGLLLYQSETNDNGVEAGTLNGAQLMSSGSMYAGPARAMTAAQMAAFTSSPSIPAAGMVNRPTIPLDEYSALKAMATWSGGQKPAEQSFGFAATSPAIAFTTDFQGAIQAENGTGNISPPDVDAAVGPTQIVQPSNSSLDVFSKTGTHLRSLSLNGFVGNFTDFLGDSRAMYDPNYNRWVVLIDDFSNLTGSGKPQYYLAISQTGDATGAFYIFPLFYNTTAGRFFDYPQLGMDQDALLFTANIFNGSALVGPIVWAIPKARVYNGLGFGVAVFPLAPSTGTVAPPFVLDTNGADYFVAAPIAPSGRTTLLKFTMSEAGRSNVGLSGPASISLPVSYISPPPDAKQTCTGTNTQLLLDTLDGRFENRSYQIGTSLWQVHTVKFSSSSSYPIPRFYQLNTSTNTTVQTGVFDRSSGSYDFNPQIAANSANSAIVTWTATDPPAGKDALVMFTGRTSATPLNTMQLPVVSTAGSTTCLKRNYDPNFGMQRWGDYSVVNLDSSSSGTGVFWITNENIIGSSTASPPTDKWATQITRVTP